MTEQKKKYMTEWRAKNKEHEIKYRQEYELANKDIRKAKRLANYRTKGIIKNCLKCNKEFFALEANLKIGKDKFCSRLCSDKGTERQTGTKHFNWTGEKVKYSGIHMWVIKWKGQPSCCEMCGTTTAKKFEWANVDHKYRRVLEDFIRMCTSCHRNYDMKFNKKTKC